MVVNKRKPREGNPFETTIVLALKRARRPLSVRKIAAKTKMNWSTANKYTKELFKRQVIKHTVTGKRKKWKIIIK